MHEINIRNVIHIIRKTTIGSKWKLSHGAFNEKYYIVTEEAMVEIDKSIKNENNENLVDVLTSKYKIKIKDSLQLFRNRKRQKMKK